MRQLRISQPTSHLRRYLAAGYVFLIAYASLSPFSGWHDKGLSFVHVLEEPLRLAHPWFDTIINFAAYLPFGVLLGLLAPVADLDREHVVPGQEPQQRRAPVQRPAQGGHAARAPVRLLPGRHADGDPCGGAAGAGGDADGAGGALRRDDGLARLGQSRCRATRRGSGRKPAFLNGRQGFGYLHRCDRRCAPDGGER